MTAVHQQKWLITGGTGFIGKALSASLVNSGMHVTVLTRNTAKAANHMPDKVNLISDLTALPSDISFDCIVNLAGEPLFSGLWTAKRKQAFFDSRLGTTSALVTLIERMENKPSVMISGSAIGYYGMSLETEFTENGPPGTDEMAQLCDQWEKAAAPIKQTGVRLAYLRTGLVMDKSGGMLPPLLLSSKLCMGAKLGDGQQWMSWISLNDIVRLILFVAKDQTISGPVNGTAPAPVNQTEFSDALAAHVNRPRFLRMPAAPMRLILGDMADLLLNGQKVLPAKALSAGFEFQEPELKQAFA
ncbi:TIGR01777 family oxidoreductase [Kordiimonas aquimaris]|uniref:TIGR01777 family oxidoreductase n=1 Tax=Kordiimonas aquimaris TaxID=707591 RepID=UPI0021CF0CFC|nr:TIGR01777 family oxidoreductase [Kordiimonas aquimaris]